MDLVVLCQSVPDWECEAVIELSREAWPAVKVLVLHESTPGSCSLHSDAIIERTGKVAIRRPGDIRDRAMRSNWSTQPERNSGNLDLVVNVAGFQMSHESIDEVSPEELDRTFRTNVYGTFFLIQAALPYLKPGAVILNTTSIQAYEPSEKLVAYAASKAADLSLTKSIAKLAAKQGCV